MKRKHSICLGIAMVMTLLYLVFLGWYIFESFKQSGSMLSSTQSTAVTIGTSILIPHLGLCVIAFIFLVVAFFTNMFAMALTSGILFCIAAVCYLLYAVFLIPSVIFTFLGSVFCYKHKCILKDEDEELVYQQNNTQIKPQQTTQAYAQRQMQYQNPTYVQSNVKQQPMYENNQMSAQAYANMPYAQDPYLPLDQTMMNDVYLNTNVQLPSQQMNWQQTILQPQMLTQYPINMENQAYYQPDDNIQYQSPQEAYMAPTIQNYQSNDGYFDEHGKFHFFNENNQ